MDQQSHEAFRPGERFPEGMEVPQRADVRAALQAYGIREAEHIRLIDSTHDPQDIRLNYLVDKKWVLRFSNAPELTEKRFGDLFRLIERYHALHIQCPQFVADAEGSFLHPWGQLQCFLSEYIDMPLASEVEIQDEDRLTREVQASLARFAEAWRNVDLSETMGMYSLFDLSPFDLLTGVDEKQENFDQLIGLLRKENETVLADALTARHSSCREKLKAVYKGLPRCVFQGDENWSNLLIDENQHFAGWIDFNMAGTEVIVNQFANVAGFDYDEKHREPVGAKHRLDFALAYFHSHIWPMLQIYHATGQELEALRWYAWIVMVAQWPTFCYFRASLSGPLRSEILELLSLIAAVPEERLAPGDFAFQTNLRNDG